MNFNSAILKLKQNPYANRIYLDDNLSLLAGDPSLEQGTLLGHSQYPVWEYIHRPSGKKYAVKKIPLRKNRLEIHDRKDNVARVEKINREIEILQKLRNCENIVRVCGFSLDDRDVRIFMEKMEISLANLIDMFRFSYAMGKFYESCETFRSLAFSCLDALSYCSRVGIVHNDIKADNILLDDHGQFKLSDFGESRCIQVVKKLRRNDIFEKQDLIGLMMTLLQIFYEVNPFEYIFERNDIVQYRNFLTSVEPETLLKPIINEIDLRQNEGEWDVIERIIRKFLDIICAPAPLASKIYDNLVEILEEEDVYREYPLRFNMDYMKELLDETNPYLNVIKFPNDHKKYHFNMNDFIPTKSPNVIALSGYQFNHKPSNNEVTLMADNLTHTTNIFELYTNLSSHPNIVCLYGVVFSISGYYSITESFDLDVLAMLQIFNALKLHIPENFMGQIVLSCLNALEAIHQKGFFNLRFGADNLYIKHDGSIKIAIVDIIEMRTDRYDGMFQVYATNFRPSPEIASRKKMQKELLGRIDIWNLIFCMVYQLLMSRMEHCNEDINQIYQEIMYDHYVSDDTPPTITQIYEQYVKIVGCFLEDLVNKISYHFYEFIAICTDLEIEDRADISSLKNTDFYNIHNSNEDKNRSIFSHFLNELLGYIEKKSVEELEDLNTSIIPKETWDQVYDQDDYARSINFQSSIDLYEHQEIDLANIRKRRQTTESTSHEQNSINLNQSSNKDLETIQQKKPRKLVESGIATILCGHENTIVVLSDVKKE